MATYSDVFQIAQFNDGQDIDFDDWNAMQRWALARFYDGWGRFLAGSPDSGDGDYEVGLSGLLSGLGSVVVPRAGSGFIDVGGGMTVRVNRGTIMQVLGDVDSGGDAPEFVPFTFLSQNTLAIAAADPTNPRCDLVQVKLEWVDDAVVSRHFEDATTRAKSSQTFVTKRRVRATVSVKTGTPGATPAIPAPDAGFARWAVARVPAAATSLTVKDVKPFQVPLQADCHNVHPYHLGRPGTPDWAISTGARISVAKLSGTDAVYAHLPRGFQAARLIGVGVHGVLVVPLVQVVRFKANSGTSFAEAVLADLSAEIAADLAGATYAQTRRLLVDDAGFPMWSNGYGPQYQAVANFGPGVLAADMTELAVKISGTSGEINGVKLFIAG